MSGREITYAQVLDAFVRIAAEESENARRESQRWRARLDEEWRQALAALESALDEKLRRLEAAHEDIVAENGRLRRENDELRAQCAKSRETKGPLDFIKTQRDADQPPQ